MRFKIQLLISLVAIAFLLSACAAKIHGTVELVDDKMQPIQGENPQGTVVHMINTTATLDKASLTATVNEKGKFESEKDALNPGKYKVEATRIGYETQTETVEIKGSTRKKIAFKLKKIDEGRRKSFETLTTDADKIINPGEVNIQPPGM
jgi:PBP1b-binding outer membrane lipoprotein LpoB